MNLRIGGGSTSERPRLCLEASPHDRFSIEACGTGSGFLHHDEGPEASVSLRHLLPIAAGLELVGDLSMGTVYLPHAPKLVRPMSPVLPWVSFTVGAGF